MNRRNRPTTTSEPLRNEQVALVLRDLEKDIEKFRLAIEKKDDQLNKYSKILKATKVEYQKFYKENKQLKDYILQQNQHKKHLEQQQQQQRQYYYKNQPDDYVVEPKRKDEDTPVNSGYETGDEENNEYVTPEKKEQKNELKTKKETKEH